VDLAFGGFQALCEPSGEEKGKALKKMVRGHSLYKGEQTLEISMK